MIIQWNLQCVTYLGVQDRGAIGSVREFQNTGRTRTKQRHSIDNCSAFFMTMGNAIFGATYVSKNKKNAMRADQSPTRLSRRDFGLVNWDGCIHHASATT